MGFGQSKLEEQLKAINEGLRRAEEERQRWAEEERQRRAEEERQRRELFNFIREQQERQRREMEQLRRELEERYREMDKRIRELEERYRMKATGSLFNQFDWMPPTDAGLEESFFQMRQQAKKRKLWAQIMRVNGRTADSPDSSGMAMQSDRSRDLDSNFESGRHAEERETEESQRRMNEPGAGSTENSDTSSGSRTTFDEDSDDNLYRE